MLVYVADPDMEQIARTVHYINLEGFQAKGFCQLPELENAFSEAVPSVLVLDLSFPEGNGFPLLRNVRLRYPCSIIVTSMSRSESDIILSYELGCDDFVNKPYSMKELTLRAAAICRRQTSGKAVVTFTLHSSKLTLRRDTHMAYLDGKDISFSAAEWKILDFFIDNPDYLVSRQQLLNACFPKNTEIFERIIDTHIKNIRKKLSPLGFEWIETVRGYGYRFRGKLSDS